MWKMYVFWKCLLHADAAPGISPNLGLLSNPEKQVRSHDQTSHEGSSAQLIPIHSALVYYADDVAGCIINVLPAPPFCRSVLNTIFFWCHPSVSSYGQSLRARHMSMTQLLIQQVRTPLRQWIYLNKISDWGGVFTLYFSRSFGGHL